MKVLAKNKINKFRLCKRNTRLYNIDIILGVKYGRKRMKMKVLRY